MKNGIKLLISLFVFVYDYIKISLCRIFRFSFVNRLIVLYYHSVKDEERKQFHGQMKLLQKKTNIIGHDKEKIDSKKRIYSIVTFDDAFLCLEKNAVPVLHDLNIKPIVFVPTEWIGKNPGWLEDLEHADSDEVVMSEKEISGLKEKIYFASHCHSHSSLKTLPLKKANEEINSSKRIMENILGHRIEAISFPYGEFNEQNYMAAKKAGYKYLFSINPEFIDYESFSNKKVIGRVKVDPSDSLLNFFLKIHGAYRWMTFASSIKRKLSAKYY